MKHPGGRHLAQCLRSGSGQLHPTLGHRKQGKCEQKHTLSTWKENPTVGLTSWFEDFIRGRCLHPTFLHDDNPQSVEVSSGRINCCLESASWRLFSSQLHFNCSVSTIIPPLICTSIWLFCTMHRPLSPEKSMLSAQFSFTSFVSALVLKVHRHWMVSHNRILWPVILTELFWAIRGLFS